jgi:hypothetical protein
MNKTKEKIIDEQNQEQKQPAYVAELLLNGTVTLTANTREELAEMVDNIPAECHYGAGAVGRHPETGLYSLRVDLTTKD